MIKKISKSIREYKKESIISAVLILIEVIMEVLIPLIMINLIDNGINFGIKNEIIKSSLLLLLVSIISLISGTLASVYSAKASSGFAKNLRNDLFKNINTFSFFNIDKYKTSSLITRLTTDVTHIEQTYMMILRMALRSPLMLILSLISAFYVNSKIALIFLLIMPFLLISLYIIANLAMPRFKELFKTYDELNNVVSENIRGIRVVKSFVKENDEKKKFNVVSKTIYEKFVKADGIVIWNAPIMQLSIYICNIFIAWFGVKYIVGGNMTTGELTSLLSYTGTILTSLMMLSMIYVMFVISMASAERIVEVLDEKSNILDGDKNIKKMLNGSIEFKNVSFSYTNSMEKLNLKNINLKINSGEFIGIIGATASGKSTLINLINRLYDTTKGDIYIGECNIKDYNLKTLRDNIGVVLQNNTLFKGSIKNNIKWGNKKASDKEIKEACIISCADEFIKKIPEKYDYVLDQSANNLSGGQKQRIAIARALIKKPKILIFDDSTSAVDTKTDAKIRYNLKKCLKDTTKIVISERIVSIEDADRIIVIDDGKIIDFDTPKNLLKNNKIYKEIYNMQKKGVKNEENKK